MGAVGVLVAACSGSTASNSSGTPAASSGAGTPASGAATAVASPGTGTPVSGASAVANGTPAGTAVAATPVGATNPASTVPIKGMNLAFVGGSYFIPEAQTLFTNQIKQFGTTNGVGVSADYLNWTDLQAKIAASVQAGAGADMFEMWPGWTYLYTDHLADVSNIADAMSKAQGGFFESWVTPSVQVNGKWLGVPTGTTNVVFSYRTSYFQQAGIDNPAQNFPQTFDDLFAVGAKLKKMGKPLGQALGHSTGDPPAFAYPYMWANGAMEVQSDGTTVAFNKPQFVDGMKRFIQAWKDAFDQSALAGDDGYNNRAFLADQISATINGTSIYYVAQKQNPDIAKDMDNATIPAGPTGRFYNLGSHSYGVLKASKNAAAAEAFLSWWTDAKQFGDWIHIQDTYQIPPTQMWQNDPMWTKDPKLAAVRDDVKYGRLIGYAGPPNQKAALSSSKYIVVDTFSRAVQSGDAQAAINWGAQQLQQIYG